MSIKVRTHSQSWTGSQVRQGTNILYMDVSARVRSAGCSCARARAFSTDRTTDGFAEKSFTAGIFGCNAKQTILESSPGSASGQVSK